MRSLAAILCWVTLFAGAPLYAVTWHVPSQCPTIQAGIDSASAGDTVLVACGTYYEHDLWAKQGVCLRSETGQAECVTIENQSPGRRVFWCSGVNASTSIEGFTITGGMGDSGGGMFCRNNTAVRISNCTFYNNVVTPIVGTVSWGGGMYCRDGASPLLTNCTFLQNRASWGGGLCCRWDASPVLLDCTFLQNIAYIPIWIGRGGAVCCADVSSATLINCTLSHNASTWGNGIVHCKDDSWLEMLNTISAFSTDGPAFSCDGTCTFVLSCCDVYGNAAGDWTGCVADQYGLNGNFSEDPLFCNAGAGDLHIDCSSPCARGGQPECGLIGAWGVGCGATRTERTSWSSLKALYR